MTDRLAFRDAMARLGAAVNIITTDGVAGRHGMTASAVCSVTDDPPTILVCINRNSAANAILKANAVLCINVLAGRHELLSGRFANPAISSPARFGDDAHWSKLATGSPVLIDAPVSLDCHIVSTSEIGTHSVFFCEVADIRLGDDPEALIWFNRRYHALAADIAA